MHILISVYQRLQGKYLSIDEVTNKLSYSYGLKNFLGFSGNPGKNKEFHNSMFFVIILSRSYFKKYEIIFLQIILMNVAMKYKTDNAG